MGEIKHSFVERWFSIKEKVQRRFYELWDLFLYQEN